MQCNMFCFFPNVLYVLSDYFLWLYKPFFTVRYLRIYAISDTPYNILTTIVFSLWVSKSLYEVDINSIPTSVYPGRINLGKNESELLIVYQWG